MREIKERWEDEQELQTGREERRKSRPEKKERREDEEEP
jgi:hypothetical protein